jgi:hypothetical protein
MFHPHEISKSARQNIEIHLAFGWQTVGSDCGRKSPFSARRIQDKDFPQPPGISFMGKLPL